MRESIFVHRVHTRLLNAFFRLHCLELPAEYFDKLNPRPLCRLQRTGAIRDDCLPSLYQDFLKALSNLHDFAQKVKKKPTKLTSQNCDAQMTFYLLYEFL